jgi:signal transduction histidine kinase/ligand-binding sensor domain-containing protein
MSGKVQRAAEKAVTERYEALLRVSQKLISIRSSEKLFSLLARELRASFGSAWFFSVVNPSEAFYPNRQIARSLWICLLIAFHCVPTFALDRDQSIVQFHHTAWSGNEGAPSNISALAQTEDGYLWIGSPQGLFRFDGVKFEEYKPQPGVELPSHGIYYLLPTPDGGLWIAFAPTGLGFLKDGSLTVFTRPEELPDSQIHTFARDHDGRIWAGTETGLVLREGTRWTPIGHDWNFAPEVVRELFVDREGTLWVATVKIIVFLRRGAKAFELAGAVGRGITTLAQAKDGRVWFADDGTGEVRPVPIAGHNSSAEDPAAVGVDLHELLIDRDGALWITRMDSGVVRIRYPERLGNRKLGPHDPELESFNEKDGFSGGFAFKLLEDREGNIWVGCSKGLFQFRHNQVVPVSLPQRYQKLVLLAGEDGEVWIGTIRSKPLLHVHGESLLVEKVGEQASSVFRDPNGYVWWGCATGIWRQHGTKFKYFPIPKGAEPPIWIYEIFPSRDDDGLWVRLGDFGTVHFKQGVWKLGERPKGVPFVGPSASYNDASGRVWLGFSVGQVYVLDGEQVTVYSKKDGLDVGRIGVIRGLAQHIWLGGELGLLVFSEGHFRRVTVAAGEPFGTVSGIIETVDGGLWLNEMRGIVQIPPEEIRRFIADPNHRVKYRRFDYLDGLPGAPQMTFTNSTAVMASDGRLWFATNNGLASIDPRHIVRNGVPPPVSILSIGNEKGRQPMSSAVRFAASTHTVEIDYTALSLSIPERVEFRYKLEGVDKDWQNVGTRRQAFYTSLGPGRYRFRVIACNNDGVWNEQGATLQFMILPAFYQTNWFLLLCIVAAGYFAWAIHQRHIAQVAARLDLTFKERLSERTRIARELHDTLLQSFHGLLLRFQAATNLLPPGEAKQTFESAIDRAAQAITEGRDAVQGLRSSTVVTNDLALALNTLGEELAGDESNPHSAEFHVAVEGTPRNLHAILRDEVYRIAGEALRNAFRHAQAGRIEVEIRYDERQLRLRVRDDGKGIDPKLLSEDGRARHYGLHGMRERAEVVGGKLAVWSELDSGTEVELSIPASHAYEPYSARRRSWLTEKLSGKLSGKGTEMKS